MRFRYRGELTLSKMAKWCDEKKPHDNMEMTVRGEREYRKLLDPFKQFPRLKPNTALYRGVLVINGK